MFKRIVISIFSLLLLLVNFQNVSAQEQFGINAKVKYEVDESGTTTVTNTVTLTNLYSDLYATTYQLTLDNIDPLNPKAFEGESVLDIQKNKTGTTTNLQVSFPDAVVGKGKSRTFTLVYENTEFASKTGEVWEISIPRLANKDAYGEYQATLVVPKSFGLEAYLSPSPLSKSEEGDTLVYLYSKEEVAKSGITAGFGKFQVFSFTLNYHLENPLNSSAKTEIALPPDTAFQRVFYDQINPKPVSLRVDDDGNWLASYDLKPRERIDIVAYGSVQMFPFARMSMNFDSESLSNGLGESKYWQVSDPQIASLAEQYRTPSEIYDFVVDYLDYDYSRVRPNVERLGARGALALPASAICMEFTDLFIAISRAAGIPAREINGFAYTENPEIQPLSLVADVLHAWPEYWNEERGVWVPVDPTWESTSGVEFFDKLDLRHFTFVIHGKDPSTPYPPGSYKLGPNPQKDVFVNFGQLPEIREKNPNIIIEPQKSFPFLASKLKVTIENPGPSAQYNLEVKVFFDGEYNSTYFIPTLLPFSSEEQSIDIPFSLLGKGVPDTITVSALGTNVGAPTQKSQVIIYSLILILAVVAFIIGFIYLKVKKVKFGDVIKTSVRRLNLLKKIQNEKSEKINLHEEEPKKNP